MWLVDWILHSKGGIVRRFCLPYGNNIVINLGLLSFWQVQKYRIRILKIMVKFGKIRKLDAVVSQVISLLVQYNSFVTYYNVLMMYLVNNCV